METVSTLLSNLKLPGTEGNKVDNINETVAMENAQLCEVMKRSSLLDLLCCACKKESLDKKISFIEIISFITGCSSVEWIVSSFQQIDKPIGETDCVLQEIYKCGLVPTSRDREHYAFTRQDFLGTAARACSVINFTKSVVMKILSDDAATKELKSNAIMQIILKHSSVLLFQHLEDNLWTTKESTSLSGCTIDLLCDLYKVKNIHSYLLIPWFENAVSNSKKSLVSIVLDLLLPCLNKNNWKKNPGIIQAFMQCVMHTKFPHMRDILDKLLPPSLLFVDDYMNENKIHGIQCLHHIIDNVTGEELRWYGRADVIYEALSHQLYSREADILEVAIPANMAAIDVVDYSESKDIPFRPLSKHDQLLERLLREAEGESLLVLRRMYTKHLSALVNIVGISTVRHLSQVIKVASEYLEVIDGPIETSRFHVLNMLKTSIRVAWPRISHYICDILKMLVKLLIDLAMDKTISPDHVKKALGEEATKCLILVKHIDDETVLNYLICVVSTDIPDSVKEFIQKVIDAELDGLS